MEFARQGPGVAIVTASAPDDLHAIRISLTMRSRRAWRGVPTRPRRAAARALIGVTRAAPAARTTP
jgi:hypothetical protein